MKNDHQNSFSWPNRLKSYDTVRNRINDKEANWDRLANRLAQKPPQRKWPWYWIAAASVIAATTVIVTFMHKRGELFTPGEFSIPVSKKEWRDTPVKMKGLGDNEATMVNQAHKGEKQPNIIPEFKQPSPDSGSAISLQVENNLNGMVPDTQFLNREMVQKPATLPLIHLNDLPGKEVPPNISTRTIGVLKLIRLFGTDMTIEQPPKNDQQTPVNERVQSNNQN